MRSPIAFFRFIAKAMINVAAGGLPVGDFIVDVLPEIGRDVWDAWAGPRTEAERRAEIEAVVLIPDSEAPSLAAEVVAEVAADQPEAVRQLVTGYLTMVPAAVRASLRRQSDPSGTTIPPDLVPHSADELIRLLPSRLPHFKPGDRPPGLDWELERFLGVGGFGEVWKARHVYQRSRSPTAVKFCNDPAAAGLLRNEVELLNRLMGTGLHPGIVRLLDTHLGAEPYCLIYEYVEGGDLTGLIQAWHRSGQGPTPSQAAELVRQLAEIIGTAHRLDPPIVHRDLKPANILVERAADASPRFKITDFGIGGLAARQVVQLSQRGVNQGRFLVSVLRGSFTPLYASPQQARGAAPDPRDDVFALGVIWFQLMTGRLDEGRPGGRLWPERLKTRGMSPELIDLLASCFEDEREDRAADARAWPTRSSPSSPHRPSRPRHRHPHRLPLHRFNKIVAFNLTTSRRRPPPTSQEVTPATTARTTTGRSPTTTRPSGSTPIRHRLLQSRHRPQGQGRPRRGDRRLRPGHPARPQVRHRLLQPRHRPRGQGRPRRGDRRLRPGHPARPQVRHRLPHPRHRP